jgi:hypothetical protein
LPTASHILGNAIDAVAEEKSAEYCAENAIAATQQCVAEFDKKVFAFCSDNENKMLSMIHVIESKYPDVILYGDSEHYLNLVAQAVTPNSLMKHIILINKYFRNHGWLTEKNGT